MFWIPGGAATIITVRTKVTAQIALGENQYCKWWMAGRTKFVPVIQYPVLQYNPHYAASFFVSKMSYVRYCAVQGKY